MFLLVALHCLFGQIDVLPNPAVEKKLSLPSQVQHVLEDCFYGIPREKMIISPLRGGYSTSIYLIAVKNKKYVLRLNEDSLEDFLRELYVMQEAANLEATPKLYYYSKKTQAIVMEYIEEKTSTIEKASLRQNCERVAAALKKAHNTPLNPYRTDSLIDHIQGLYDALTPQKQKEAKPTIDAIHLYHAMLSSKESPTVNIHGDLNPRNLFITDDQILIIDWSMTRVDDPFYDLSFFALFHNYDRDTETFFLSTYLEREPTSDEWYRYMLIKQINYGRLAIIGHFLSDQFERKTETALDVASLPKRLPYYVKLFGHRTEKDSPAQFFYDLARAASREIAVY